MESISCYHVILGTRRSDHHRNEAILRQVGKKLLIETVRKRQLGWLGHTMRLGNQTGQVKEAIEPAKTFALYVPAHGYYKQGPRQLSYRHQIAKLLTDTPDLHTD